MADGTMCGLELAWELSGPMEHALLVEADRMPQKHLLTLKTAISDGQTNEMAAKNVQFAVPRSLHSSYSYPRMSLHGI